MLRDSWKLDLTGPKVAMSTILESWLSELVRMRVSLEERYGMKVVSLADAPLLLLLRLREARECFRLEAD